jgi:nucleoside-diphosphate-sugar epimerase
MKILFTGGSSFTGYRFIKELAAYGHEVTAVFRRRQADEYVDDVRRKRVRALLSICHPVFGPSFGDDRFLQLISGGRWDLLCHHGAEVANYRSPDFNVIAAIESNTCRLPTVLNALEKVGCSKIILTGSVFEQDEGTGSPDLRAFSPYGLSKGFTWQIFRYYAQIRQLGLGKFVIPNPFGPYEEPRFTHYLISNWFAGQRPAVNTPLYVRDNIHVSLLAKSYAHFAMSVSTDIRRISPSGYSETQGAFTERLAREMRPRLDLSCEFELKTQIDFSEPHIRVNTEPCDAKLLNWNEAAAWDEMAEYYATLMMKLE